MSETEASIHTTHMVKFVHYIVKNLTLLICMKEGLVTQSNMQHAAKIRTCKFINNTVRKVTFWEVDSHWVGQKNSYLIFFNVLATFRHWTALLAT
jgi:hypothetical protein